MDDKNENIDQYSWLKKIYRNMVYQYKKKKYHHSTIIETIDGMGDEILIWNFSCWIMCQNNTSYDISCKICHHCRLMKKRNHPDWYCVEAEDKKKLISVDIIRKLIEKLFNYAQQDGPKIVWFPFAEQLGKSSMNSLLKILEEPPSNTWFFISSKNFSYLSNSIKSRCFKISLLYFNEKENLNWLKAKTQKCEVDLITALRLCGNGPIAAFSFLSNDILWNKRKILFFNIMIFFRKKIFQEIFTILNDDQLILYTSWLLTFFLDFMKWKVKATYHITNCDCINIFKENKNFFSYSILYNLTKILINARKFLIKISAINRELIIVKLLLDFEEIINL
ncbi:DNA polymerase III subunit delta' C-terminal domain-containing protein [Candidatus Tachikawaea gelatinosa]|uniref:DNA polymerase III subunit delta' n=1 Tax=Candidatus Tachikawaea gelatinosa TaxID=1410383 RepID=A0A090ASG7_9ENTR|nr:DNA polymerase III subunit delta' C-terminal domain-containing protein [Candidatus Tachikawaea gelatinosa]BAP58810.1 DNA polymerase III delta' subunit HolB [Candidatus Tachikawaea gelatinosa]